jgi:hypothetical protein
MATVAVGTRLAVSAGTNTRAISTTGTTGAASSTVTTGTTVTGVNPRHRAIDTTTTVTCSPSIATVAAAGTVAVDALGRTGAALTTGATVAT